MSTSLTEFYFYALGGVIVVFTGLIVIAIVIALFNRLAQNTRPKAAPSSELPPAQDLSSLQVIPPAELAAIAAALECYRRIHFEQLATQITFVRGPQQSAWKTGFNYSQRLNTTRLL